MQQSQFAVRVGVTKQKYLLVKEVLRSKTSSQQHKSDPPSRFDLFESSDCGQIHLLVLLITGATVDFPATIAPQVSIVLLSLASTRYMVVPYCGLLVPSFGVLVLYVCVKKQTTRTSVSLSVLARRCSNPYPLKRRKFAPIYFTVVKYGTLLLTVS